MYSKNKIYTLLVGFLALNLTLNSFAAANKKKPITPVKPVLKQSVKSETKKTIKNEVTACSKSISIQDLVSNPDKFLNKEICIDGTFSSFSALALDYPPAMRERRKYVSLTLFRPNTQIPLGELKLAINLEDAQKHTALTKIAEGDSVKIKGKVFSASLGEPWMDINQIQITKSSNTKDAVNELFAESEE